MRFEIILISIGLIILPFLTLAFVEQDVWFIWLLPLLIFIGFIMLGLTLISIPVGIFVKRYKQRHLKDLR